MSWSDVCDEILAEFSRVLDDYNEEKTYIHTKYLADFIMENPEKYPLLNQIGKKTTIETRLTQCFQTRGDFIRPTEEGKRAGYAALWKRVEEEKQAVGGE